MSYDLHVFGSTALDAADIQRLIEELDGCRLVGEGGASGGLAVEKKGRAGFDYCFNIDGPLRVEQEDLPEAVVAGAVGVRWTHQLSVGGSSKSGIQLAGRSARAIAERCDGVVYDPQQDSIVWPRGGARRFKPEPAAKIDLVHFEWLLRREDLSREVAAIVFDSIRVHLPEGLPRRFGSFEPLQFRLDEAGRDGFIATWRGEPMTLFWKGSRPCIDGSMNGLGDELVGEQHAGPHPVGSVGLSFDHRAFLDERWRDDAVQLFVRLSEHLPVFFAQADIRKNVGYSGGNVWYGPDTITNPGLMVRNVWMGLPCFDVWLAWFGGLYRPLVRDHLPEQLTQVHERGLLVRADHILEGRTDRNRGARRRWRLGPPKSEADQDLPLPAELLLNATGEPPGGWIRERADLIPDGL